MIVIGFAEGRCRRDDVAMADRRAGYRDGVVAAGSEDLVHDRSWLGGVLRVLCEQKVYQVTCTRLRDEENCCWGRGKKAM